MLDIDFIRQQPEIIREDLKKRQDKEKLEWIEDLLTKDKQWREFKQKADQLRHRRNLISQEINTAKKQKKDITTLLKEVKDIPRKIQELETDMQKLQEKIKFYLMRIPNILHNTVPVGKDDSENKLVRLIGKKPNFKFQLKSHVDLIEQLDLVELERAAKISGARWYFLKNELALLDLALMRYAIDFMVKRKFKLLIPPFMINRKSYEGVTSLGDFEDTLYKTEGEDLYAIATSEHPLTAQYMDEVLKEEDLPIKLVGYSSCFRKEAGAHGKDTKGIFRVHQFNKVEQIVICEPEQSWHIHEELIKTAEQFFKSLGIHCRTVNICTGDIGIVAAKKYDLEAWMPAQNTYREVVSCSNCTTYQATRLNIKYTNKNGEKKHVHTLNSTCVADTRALVAILENFQQKDGSIKIPKVLHKYCGFKTITK